MANIISFAALMTAALSLWLSYLNYKNENADPELFARLKSFEITVNSASGDTTIDGQFEIALTNSSDSEIEVVSCIVGIPDFEIWEAGLTSEYRVPCGGVLQDISRTGSKAVSSGQTVRFTEAFQETNLNPPEISLRGLGLNKEQLVSIGKAGVCRLKYYYDLGGTSYMDMCDLRSGKVLFTVYLQLGTGEIIARAIPPSGTDDWPWLNVSLQPQATP